MLWISVHLPKTAGISFSRSLQAHFGDAVLKDYGDLPMNTAAWKRKARAAWNCLNSFVGRIPDVRCIHGHFMPVKYLGLARRTRVKFITWMRHPVERLVSTYHFAQRWYANSSPREIMIRRIVEEEWSLEKFLFHPYYRNFYSKFLWGFSMSRFEFIGIVEHFDEDMAYFSRHHLGSCLPVFEENRNPRDSRVSYLNDPALRQRVEDYHARDMVLYGQALEYRHQRMQFLGENKQSA